MGNTYQGTTSVQTQYDWTNTPPSEAVISAVASLEDVEPVSLSAHLDITLYEYIDPEALDRLVTDGSSLSVSFPIDDYEISIDGNRLIVCYD